MAVGRQSSLRISIYISSTLTARPHLALPLMEGSGFVDEPGVGDVGRGEVVPGERSEGERVPGCHV